MRKSLECRLSSFFAFSGCETLTAAELFCESWEVSYVIGMNSKASLQQCEEDSDKIIHILIELYRVIIEHSVIFDFCADRYLWKIFK